MPSLAEERLLGIEYNLYIKELYKGLLTKTFFVDELILKYTIERTRKNYGQRTALPLALLELSTALPATVFILDLNPCLRLRFKLLG
jgi:hypothetical protein